MKLVAGSNPVRPTMEKKILRTISIQFSPDLAVEKAFTYTIDNKEILLQLDKRLINIWKILTQINFQDPIDIRAKFSYKGEFSCEGKKLPLYILHPENSYLLSVLSAALAFGIIPSGTT